MSQTTKKMMSLELEFIEPTAHGFISWVDYETGEPLATLGLGSTGKDSGEDAEGNTIGIDNGGAKYLEWNLDGVDYIKVTGGGIQFDEQRSLSIDSMMDVDVEDEYGDITVEQISYIPSQIQLNSQDYTTYEFANVIYESDMQDINGDGIETEQNKDYQDLLDNKTKYADNTNAMIFEHENAIAFVNPITERMIGMVDTVNESLAWYGAFALGDPVADSYFEIKRIDPTKQNFTLNADDLNIPSLSFKKEDVIQWSISVDTNLILKNVDGHGIDISDTAVTFTDEIIYQGQPLIDYFYEKTILDDGVLDARYYIKEEIDTLISEAEERVKEELRPIAKEAIDMILGASTYYMYDSEWVEITYIAVDEEYDLPDTAEYSDIYYAELEDKWLRYNIDTFDILPVQSIENKEFPHIIKLGDYALVNETLGSNTIYKWDGNSWIETNLNEDDIYTNISHKSDISIDGVYKVVLTNKFYKYEAEEFIEIDNPLPEYDNEYNLPDQFNFNTVVINTFVI